MIAPEPVENHAEIPVRHRVTEEEKMATPELGCQRHGDGAGEIRLREIVDVVVLRDDEALPLTVWTAVNLSMELEDDGAPLQGKLGGVGVRQIDEPATSLRRDVAELASSRARRNVGDDVEFFTRFEERGLEREVVARRHDQLVRHPTLAQNRRDRREESVNGCRRDV